MSLQAALGETSKPARPARWQLHSEFPVSLLVLAAGLLATYLLWQNAQRQHIQELQNEFDSGVREAEMKIERRLSNYQNVLRGLQALYAATGRVERDEFSAYAAALHLGENFPGIQSLDYSALVPADRLQQHMADVRGQGFPGYRIEPAGKRALYAPVVQVAPFRGGNQRVFGLDNYATPERRAVLEHARDSGNASLSGKLTLVQEGEPPQAGILMTLPIYRNGTLPDTPVARRAEIVGWVSAAFRLNTLMANLLDSHTPYLDIEIYDALDMSAAALLYDSDNDIVRGAEESGAAFRSTRLIQVADRPWTVSYTSTPAFDAKLTTPHAAIEAAVGSLASLTLALCAWLLLRSRRRALLDAWRLKEAMQQSEIASRAKSEFLANIGHELRTPMNAILGMTHLALAEESEPRKRSRLEKIQFSGEHLLNTIDNILDYSGMEYGTPPSRPVDFTLRKVLGDLENFASLKAAGKNVELSVDIPPGLSRRRLRGDAARLEQVLHNFLDNAIKFTPEGRITLRVLRQEEDETSFKLRFEVQDSGIGIETDKLRHLFSPFWQADGSSTRKHEGIGLGLAICKKLIETMKEGKFGVDSVPGSGSTFWFSTRLDKAQTRRTSQENAVTTGSYTNIKGARILVAEDNVLSQTIISGLLESAGAVVQRARNGEEALELLRGNAYDCVLMDVQMPEMDGIAATRAIRADPALAELPVIAVTAHASRENRRRCLDAGMSDFIGKPFTPASLYTKLAHWLPPRHDDAPPIQLSLATVPQAEKPRHPRNGEIIDLSQLAELIGDDRKKMREFAGKFLELARHDVTCIETALAQNDRETLVKLAHHNKAPARMVGARGFADLCQELSDLSKQAASTAQIGKAVSQMRPLLDLIEQHVQRELAY